MEDLRALIVKSCTVFGLQSLLVDDVHIVALLPFLNIHTCAHSWYTLYLCALSLSMYVYWCFRHYTDRCLADVHFCTLYGLLTRNIINSVVFITFFEGSSSKVGQVKRQMRTLILWHIVTLRFPNLWKDSALEIYISFVYFSKLLFTFQGILTKVWVKVSLFVHESFAGKLETILVKEVQFSEFLK